MNAIKISYVGLITALLLYSCDTGQSNSDSLTGPFAIEMKMKTSENQLPVELATGLSEYEVDVIDYMNGILFESPNDRMVALFDFGRSEVEMKTGNTVSGLFGAVKAVGSGVSTVVQNDMLGTVILEIKRDGIVDLTSSMSDQVKKTVMEELASIENACQFSARSKRFLLYYNNNEVNIAKECSKALNDNPSPKFNEYENLLKHKVIIDYVEEITLKKLESFREIWLMRYYLVRNHNTDKGAFLSAVTNVLMDKNAEIETGDENLNKSISNLRDLLLNLSTEPSEVKEFLKFASEETNEELNLFKKQTKEDILSYFLDM